MRNVTKRLEPRSLTEHRAKPFSNFDGCEKQDLRESLFKEQSGICCYCMCRIEADRYSMKIEHWQSQTGFPTLQLTYSNLLGACVGGEGQPRRQQTCDTHKGDLDLSKNPSNAAHNIAQFIKFSSSERIEATNTRLNNELNEVLNLNHPRLINERKEVLAGFLKKFPRQGRVGPFELRNWRNQWNTPKEGRLRPFYQVIVYWLDKRLARGN
jgi:uncharacterized protein (TIGR02646 family)